MTMRVRFLRGTGLGGIGNDALPGDERDLPDTQAAQLVANGRAVAIAADTPAADTPAADTPAADTPAADTPAADTPAADTPAADTPAHSSTSKKKGK